jgi:hypothetical protein
LTCQDDPYCSDYTTFKPTNEKYPGTGVDEKTHLPDFWDDIRSDPGDTPQRWAWLNHELSAIPEEERGTIPTWKLFTTTYVGRGVILPIPSLRETLNLVLCADSGELDRKTRPGISRLKTFRGTP